MAGWMAEDRVIELELEPDMTLEFAVPGLYILLATTTIPPILLATTTIPPTMKAVVFCSR